MQHKLSDIINTDCYIQFDSNEELREFVKANRIKMHGNIHDEELFLSVYSKLLHSMSTVIANSIKPIYHHENIIL